MSEIESAQPINLTPSESQPGLSNDELINRMNNWVSERTNLNERKVRDALAKAAKIDLITPNNPDNRVLLYQTKVDQILKHTLKNLKIIIPQALNWTTWITRAI